MFDKAIWIFNHDIILIGCFLGLMCGAVIRIVMTIIEKIIDRKEKKMIGINNYQYNQMLEEYKKDRKFADYVKRCMQTYGTNLSEELHKVITWEYYKSVADKDGCNKEK